LIWFTLLPKLTKLNRRMQKKLLAGERNEQALGYQRVG
jgi:hypothetical protein